MHFLDESFWLAISFIIFVYLIYRPAKKAILKSLDMKVLEVQERVLKAEKLKDDAKLLFEQTEEQIKNLEALQLQMTKENNEITEKIVQEKTKEIEEFLEHKKVETIKLIESQKLLASKELQDEFSDEVVKLVSEYFHSTKNNNLSETDIAKNLMDKV
ncbi:ATP F0F1 synthase subunit B [Rickettsia bellii]|uniref:ATP synthase subunit b n=3 Tax=Rickettsia bellii TaxID=33990 RepID=ATPF_RICBR|nr:F0F1 ATP synthase subunit B [Rickettsia bellii]Q1RGZ0.1 RecName: Full=ATP synthase subunit b; AltName: Full=ATP synthase F(0) sector subunit b; AltName: Full=ATPase subunit I; AltName: Full=F-type ATPase subunit b; Short=F-ATPase subunit b [Rickettsia bellii RML369-C]ABE05374.1 ATP synthase B chain [Rickettsia bellii RML369-C]ABV78486.1 F0F1 ATP synthase subunit B [Rickettsia bellii OSU 85-389]ARD86225.1 ATP F0F1 synthase subunit B [Rickettsia bellii]KJV90253.1 ATP synthase B/B' CF family p